MGRIKNQYIFCPADSAADYVAYMRKRKIRYAKIGESWNSQLGLFQTQFKIPTRCRPTRWKIG